MRCNHLGVFVTELIPIYENSQDSFCDLNTEKITFVYYDGCEAEISIFLCQMYNTYAEYYLLDYPTLLILILNPLSV